MGLPNAFQSDKKEKGVLHSKPNCTTKLTVFRVAKELACNCPTGPEESNNQSTHSCPNAS